MTAEAESPWRFLSPLSGDDPADRQIIAETRTEDLQIVAEMVSASRVSLLYAYSGNGKSSLINAGIIPLFKRRGYGVFRTRPRPPFSIHNPTRAFKECILREIDVPAFSQGELQRIRDLRDEAGALMQPVARQIEEALAIIEGKLTRLQRLTAEPAIVAGLTERVNDPLPVFLGAVRDFLGSESKLLLICDQFEELFVHYNNTPELNELIEELGAVWADSSLRAHLLFSMREDWVGSMIAFRQAIPDIFINYYRLSPLSRGKAMSILSHPLESSGLQWESGLVERVVDDLVLSYSANQSNRFSGVDLMPSPAEDPYIELPALQVVAEAFWRTREEQEHPFSADHYQALAQAATNGAGAASSSSEEPTPVQHILDGYLATRLRELRDPDESDGDRVRAMEELRLDSLYALTDRTRHRRALTMKELLWEVNRLRPRELEAPIDMERLDRAVAPLVTARLVVEHQTPDGQRQLELAHDFAVRSAVRDWRQLDRQRSARLVLLQQAEEAKAAKLEELTGKESAVFRTLGYGSGLGLLALLGFAPVTLWLGSRLESSATVGSWVLSLLFGIVIVLAVIYRKGWSAVAGIVGLVGAVLLAIPIEGAGFGDTWSAPSGESPQGIPAPIRLEGEISTYLDVDAFLFTLVSQDPVDITVKSLPNSTLDPKLRLLNSQGILVATNDDSMFPGENGEPTPTRDSHIHETLQPDSYRVEVAAYNNYGPYLLEISVKSSVASTTLREVETGPSIRLAPEARAVLLLIVYVLGLTALLCSLPTLLRHREQQRFLRILGAEWVDTLLFLPLTFLLWFGTMIFIDEEVTGRIPAFLWILGTVVVLGVYACTTALLVSRFGWTPGPRRFGLAICDASGGKPQYGRAVARQALFIVWASLLVLSGSLLLLLSWVIIRKSRHGQGLYDTWSGSRMVERA